MECALDVARILLDLHDYGITAIVRIDHERAGMHAKPWTVSFLVQESHRSSFIRIGAAEIHECFDFVFAELRSRRDLPFGAEDYLITRGAE